MPIPPVLVYLFRSHPAGSASASMAACSATTSALHSRSAELARDRRAVEWSARGSAVDTRRSARCRAAINLAVRLTGRGLLTDAPNWLHVIYGQFVRLS